VTRRGISAADEKKIKGLLQGPFYLNKSGKRVGEKQRLLSEISQGSVKYECRMI